ncbi:hypothetical protein V3481_007842 [Fusarium oxysporum f. sp. vasinfectum]
MCGELLEARLNSELHRNFAPRCFLRIPDRRPHALRTHSIVQPRTPLQLNDVYYNLGDLLLTLGLSLCQLIAIGNLSARNIPSTATVNEPSWHYLFICFLL